MELHLPFSDPAPITEDVEEPSVLEYARGQGICVDYTTELPRLVDICLSLRDTVDWDLQDSLDDDLTNAVAAADELLKKRLALAVNKETAHLLRTFRTVSSPLTSYSLAVEGLQRIRGLKQELPVLQTDAELDALAFGRKIEPNFGDLQTGLPLADLDEENDEGLGWPARYAAYPAQCDAKVRSERLTVTKETLQLLQSVMRDDCSTQYDGKIRADALERRRDLVPRHLTPPLLPLSPPSSPYIPSSPVNHLPLLPESSDSVTAEAKALEHQIMAKDSLLRLHSGDSSDSMLLYVADLDALFDADAAIRPPSSDRIPTILKRKVDDLKVEGPLTPPMFPDSPTKKLKSVSFSTMIQVGDCLEPWPDELGPMTSSESTMDELLKEIEPVAKAAKWKAENERLTGADTIARVDVPVVDFTLPTAPWSEFSQRGDNRRRPGLTELEAQMRFLQRTKRDELKTATAWRGVSDLDMKWGWFSSPNSSTIKLHEKLHGETELNKIQADLKTGNIATSSKEVWKREGLRVLDEDEDDDEEDVEPAEFEERNDMDTLVRKRKLELEAQTGCGHVLHERNNVRLNLASRHLSHQTRDATLDSHHELIDTRTPQRTPDTLRIAHPPLGIADSSAGGQEKAPTDLMFGGFPASTALHKFMQTRGKAIQPEQVTIHSSAPVALHVHPSPSMIREPLVEGQPLLGKGSDQTAEHLSRPMPELTRPFDLPPSSFVISSVLLQRRSLVKEIERLHPQIELIYRDYTLPHSVMAEADIILSPSTGVFLTTLQQIKQMPLPGQAARSLVKERMAKLQERYERLVVLVSEGLREGTGYGRPEDVRDKEMLKNIEVFAFQLEGDVNISFVAGGEQALARAVVTCMVNHGLPHGGTDMGDIKLLPQETTWEVFLRHAGLNPFAAQVILASLKTPTAIVLPPLLNSPATHASQQTIQTTGLSTFLLMEQEDRAKQFQASLGGRRILDRVSALLDQRWLSAAHGFRM
ncbi:hypothetical protein SVAN01_05356 [Stagonosporopsis vannaccii]|nr:hypothetical protein SVAN01_05356 [Stagonosporopsis vannaccii]